ncbi:MAG: nitroreductase family protein [Candidatus Wallbacteria bacterium]|nr:nitroreductase family protein [Candidatus Wallbacteria bacterium]
MKKETSQHGVKVESTGTYPNETIWRLCERGSCRSFSNKLVASDVQELLFKAATHAPTGGNLQPFSIIKIEDRKVSARLSELVEGQAFVAEAPLNLLFCLDWHRLRRWAELESAPFSAHHSFRHFWISIQDTAMSAQNLCTAADSMGLGSVYIGTVLECFSELKVLFDLPELVFPVVLLSLGYPKFKPSVRKKLAASVIVHTEKYREMTDLELRQAFEEKYPDVKIEATTERIEQMAKVCRAVEGDEFAEKCLGSIREHGYINAVQRYFGLHYVADEMALGNAKFLETFREFGFGWFDEYEKLVKK